MKTVADALAPLAVEVIAARFDPGALEQAKVYPGGWQADPERKEWLCDAFLQLRAFYVAAAGGQYAMLLYVV